MSHQSKERSSGSHATQPPPTWLSKILTAVGVGAILAIVVGIVLLLFVGFGSCRTVTSIVELIPDEISVGGIKYNSGHIAERLRRWRHDCDANVGVQVFRFCNDHPFDGGYRLNEEAVIIKLTLQYPDDRPISKLTLHLTPGVISGTPGENGPYMQIMDTVAGPLTRGASTSPMDIAHWKIDYASKDPFDDGEILIHYYALMDRTDQHITCEDFSQPTKISYELEQRFSSQQSGSRVPATHIVSWNQIKAMDVNFFTESRDTAKRIAPTIWPTFPRDYPDEGSDYATPRFKFCERVQCQLP